MRGKDLFLLSVLVLMLSGTHVCPADEGKVFEKLDDAARGLVDQLSQAAKRQSGPVVHVADDGLVYVALGAAMSVITGELLDLVTRGQAILGPDGQVLGHEETNVGVLRVDRVQAEKLALCTVEALEPGQQSAKGQVAYTRGIPTKAIAIADFLNASRTKNQLGHEFALHLAQALSARPPFTVLEREQLDTALKELGFALNDLFDPAKAQQLGKLLPSECVVLGEIFQGAGSYTVNSRIVDLETGAAVETASVGLTRSPEFDKKFGATSTGSGGPGNNHPPATNVILYAGTPTPRVRAAFAEAGLHMQEITELPRDLGPSTVPAIVLQDPACVRKGDPERIASYVETGGGVALVGVRILEGLVPGSVRGRVSTEPVAHWLGVSGVYDWPVPGIRRAGGFPPGYEGPEVLYRAVSDIRAVLTTDKWLSEYARKVLIADEDEVLGFTHTYGKGRVYWQSFVDAGPNYPQLSQYFGWAVRWVAHMSSTGSEGRVSQRDTNDRRDIPPKPRAKNEKNMIDRIVDIIRRL